MKEISKELLNRDAVICVNCGAIFDEVTEEEFYKACPECGKKQLDNGGGCIYWITVSHSWIIGTK